MSGNEATQQTLVGHVTAAALQMKYVQISYEMHFF